VSSKIGIVSIVGARPQFVKLAPVARALEQAGSFAHRVIHTGQHYDDRMSAVFFDELELPRPDIDLEVGSGSHGVQTAAMLAGLEEAFESNRPDVVLVYGDTNSTLAATLAATKIHIPVAHIEAGLRSFNRSMPEEINRLVADHCGDRLYAPTPTAMKNLAAEHLADRAVQSGDVMRDAVLHNRQLAREKSRALETLQLEPGQYGLLTIHRPINTTAESLEKILGALESQAAATLPLIFPVHPRTRPLVSELGYDRSSALRVIEPSAYLDMLQLLEGAAVVVTDSGGVQKEAAFLSTPCITLREETEWTETIDMGVNRLVGQNVAAIKDAFAGILEPEDVFDKAVAKELDRHYGNGASAGLIASDLVSWFATAQTS